MGVYLRPRSFRTLAATNTPPLLAQVLQHFEGKHLKVFVDCTLGAGGHASELIMAHPEVEVFVGLDIDPDAIAVATPRLESAVSASKNEKLKLQIMHATYKHVRGKLFQLDPGLLTRGVDGMLMHLGVSPMQMNSPQRGFNFNYDGPLDMRMDRSDTKCRTAETIVNAWTERELARLLRNYGEEPRWKALAYNLFENRGSKTTQQLVKLIGGKRKFGEHPAARTFQALQLAVNDGIGSLRIAIPQCVSCLVPGGRLAVISSLNVEEKVVRCQFEALCAFGSCKVVTDTSVPDESQQHRTVSGSGTNLRLLVIEKVHDSLELLQP